MELRHAAYFIAVAEEGNFTRAASRLHIAQPGLSAQIRQLEAELGQRLLDRSSRKVALTTAGAAVLPYFRAALRAIADARTVVDEFSGLIRGRVAVGMVTGCSSIELASLLSDYHQRHPAVEIVLSEANSDRLVDDLRTGRLDLALIGLASDPPAGIETQVVTDEPIVAAVSPRDELSRQSAIPLKALQGRTLNCLPRGTGIRTCLDNACAAAGFQPYVAFESTSLNILAQLSAKGLGVAILPESFATASALHVIRIIEPRLRGRIELAWRTEGHANKAAVALINDARRAFATEARKGKTSSSEALVRRNASPTTAKSPRMKKL